MKICKGVIKLIVAVLAILILCCTTKVQATEMSVVQPLRVVNAGGDLGNIISAGNQFISKGSGGSAADKGYMEFAEDLSSIGSILAGIGIIVFLVVLAIIAIKWMVAKPDEKAKLKQALIGYIIAAFVFFGAVGIWKLAITIMQDVESSI